MTTLTKKITHALFCGLLLSVSAFADTEGSFMVNGGFNIGALLPHFKDKIDNSLNMGGRLQADYKLKQNMTVGLEAGFSNAQVGETDFSIGTVPVLARVAWHPFSLESLSPYFVGKAGYGFGFWTKEGDDYDWEDVNSGFVWGASMGTRFFFTKNFGLFVEAGYECLDLGWEHPGMELEKWEESVSARTFGVIGLTVRFGG